MKLWYRDGRVAVVCVQDEEHDYLYAITVNRDGEEDSRTSRLLLGAYDPHAVRAAMRNGTRLPRAVF